MLLIHLLSVSLTATGGGFQQPPAAQTPPTTVTFSEPAAPLSRLMPDLAAATHLPLLCSRSIADEVLLVNVHEVSVEDLMKHMAQAVGGEWSKEKDGYFLGPDVAKRTRLEEQGLQARVQRLEKELKDMSPEAKAAAKKDAKDPQAEGAAQTDVAMPFSRGEGDEIFYHVLATIGAQQLATIGEGERAVLSTRPTNKQFQLPDVGNAISNYVARRNAAAAQAKAKAAAAAAAASAGSDDGDDEDMVPPQYQNFGRFGANKSIDKPPAKALFSIERGGGAMDFFGGQDLTCELILYDDKGNIIGRDTGGVGSQMDQEEMQAMMDEQQHKTKAATSEKPIELSTESKQFSLYLRSLSGGGADNQANALSAERKAKVLERMMHPDEYDPLAYPSDLLIGLSKAKNVQLVASLPDNFASWLIAMFIGTETPAQVMKKLSTDRSLVADTTGGWITISPNSFRSEPINRVELRKVCEMIKSTKNPSIDQLCRAAAAGMGDPTRGALSQLWVMLVDMQAMSMFSEDWGMLRLYATLSTEQRLTLTQTKRLSISALGPEQRDMLERMVYGAANGMGFFGNGAGRLSVENKPDANSLLGPTQEAFQDSMDEFGPDGMAPNDYRSEPTEAAPTGLPAGTAITLREVSTQVLEPEVDPNKSKSSAMDGWLNQPMGVEQVASMVAMREMPQYGDQMGMMPKFDHVLIGTKRTMHFRIYVSPESYLPSHLSDCSFPAGSSYALNALPGDLQKKYDEALKQMRDAYKNQGTEGGGDTGGGGGAPPR